ncbi:hypothetical protein FGADI_7545 [Fusarium gaditjirri]|uniref:Uncharacterized protein n=1 Tax=Fusarium gaditjirri TaxID=282569 RepID=A0A8H4WUY2_9HYPO|nr:hypothetical protein FGADI_7545 [Fusarium gaditjirri]
MVLKPYLSIFILFGLLVCLATAAPPHDPQPKGSNGDKGLKARAWTYPPPPPTPPPPPKWPWKKNIKQRRPDEYIMYRDHRTRMIMCSRGSFWINIGKWAPAPYEKYEFVQALQDPKTKLWQCPARIPNNIPPKKRGLIERNERNREKPEKLEKPEKKISNMDTATREVRNALRTTEIKIKQISRNPPKVTVKFINRGPYRIQFREVGSPMDRHAFDRGFFVIFSSGQDIRARKFRNTKRGRLDIKHINRDIITLNPNQTVEQDVLLNLAVGNTRICDQTKWYAYVRKNESNSLEMKMYGKWGFISVMEMANGTEYEADKGVNLDFSSNTIRVWGRRLRKPLFKPVPKIGQ